MTPSDKIRKELEEAKRELAMLQARLDDRPEFGLGKGGAGADLYEMWLARKEVILARIQNLEEALRRLEQGAYGRCVRCGKEIQPERLEILPATQFCSDCARYENEDVPPAPPRPREMAVE